MRTRTIFTTAIAVALVMLGTLGMQPAFGQSANPFSEPPDPVLGVQYDMTNAGAAKLHGAAVDYDTPMYGNHMRLALGGAFGTTEMVNETFAGAGPGVRVDTGRVHIFAHALFGYRRIGGNNYMNDSGFDARFVGGIDYALGEKHAFRAGGAYGGNAHVTVGMAFRF